MFERMLVSREAQPCALLWRCYLAAELRFGRPQAARRVFLRAIHECPGKPGARMRRTPLSGRAPFELALHVGGLGSAMYRV